MNDVLTSLDTMSQPNTMRKDKGDSPINIWSPEAFDEVYSSARRTRAQSTREVNMDEQLDDTPTDRYSKSHSGFRQEPESGIDFAQTMEDRLRSLQVASGQNFREDDSSGMPMEIQRPTFYSRPPSAFGNSRPGSSYQDLEPDEGYNRHVGSGHNQLRKRKSAYELGRQYLGRTFTVKSSVTSASSAAHSTSTNNSHSTQATSQSLMSGHSASGISATSAGSLARRKFGLGSLRGRPKSAMETQRPGTSASGISYHSSHESAENGTCMPLEAADLGGLLQPQEKKRGLFKRFVDTAKTTAATARSTMSATSSSRPSSRAGGPMPQGISSVSSQPRSQSAAREMGLGGDGDMVQMRRDVNRSNSLSSNERRERSERCQMWNLRAVSPVDVVTQEAEGNEGANGEPVFEATDYSSCNMGMVDKSSRFVTSLPAMVNPSSLAQGYLCRPYRSDAQRLRAIFTWVAERIAWEEDFEGDVDTRRVIQTRRGCSKEVAVLVAEMCKAIGIHTEIVRGFLKAPTDNFLSQDLEEVVAHPNHWWNAVLADDEWRIIDCSLASPTNPKRGAYSNAGAQVAEAFWFLARPLEICYTHVPLLPEHQHIVPPMPHDILMALPVASPSCFKYDLRMWDFNTSLLHLDGLEMAQVQIQVPGDVECFAELDARSFARDADGDLFESGEVVRKRAIAQAEYITNGSSQPFKRYTIKAVLPATAGNTSLSKTGTLNVYAGKRGLMHSISNNPHSLALSLPLTHSGENPEFEFFLRHPTPHALRHELYVTGPLCKRLYVNNTFLFSVRQHAAVSSLAEKPRSTSPAPSLFRPTSAMSIARPGSAMSMKSISASGSQYSDPSTTGPDEGQAPSKDKPAKLAIQTPSGKILRMTRKIEATKHRGRRGEEPEDDFVNRVGSLWETAVKVTERGTWRGLVLADRSARWCVFGEWEC